ncbi:unnamed protein product [Phaeothamnion confervicola]
MGTAAAAGIESTEVEAQAKALFAQLSSPNGPDMLGSVLPYVSDHMLRLQEPWPAAPGEDRRRLSTPALAALFDLAGIVTFLGRSTGDPVAEAIGLGGTAAALRASLSGRPDDRRTLGGGGPRAGAFAAAASAAAAAAAAAAVAAASPPPPPLPMGYARFRFAEAEAARRAAAARRKKGESAEADLWLSRGRAAAAEAKRLFLIVLEDGHPLIAKVAQFEKELQQ